MDNPHVVSLREPKKQEQSPIEPPRNVVDRIPPRRRRSYMPVTLLTLIILGSMGGGTYYYMYRYTPTEATKEEVPATGDVSEDARVKAVEEITDVVAAVGKHIILPEGEQPTVATVSDPEKLKDQPFFAKAKVGDKVLIYTQAKKAYLYDPVVDKLVEVAPLTTYDE